MTASTKLANFKKLKFKTFLYCFLSLSFKPWRFWECFFISSTMNKVWQWQRQCFFISSTMNKVWQRQRQCLTLLDFLIHRNFFKTYCMVISAFKCDSRYHFADSMKPFFALVALCISYLSSVGGAYGTRHRQYNYTFKIAVSHLTTSPVIVGNGVIPP